MGYETILVRTEGPAAIITLNRPEKYNAISVQLGAELAAALLALEGEADVRGIIITGQTKFFSTGADLNDVTAVGNGKEMVGYLRMQRAMTDAVEENAKPVIAAISGWCLTGGLELAMACDMRVADETAKFGITSSKIGSVAGFGGTQRLPRLVGPAKAKELLFSADFIDAPEAHRTGLINRLVRAGEAVAEARRMIDVYTERGPLSLQYMKQAVNVGIQMDLRSALDFEINLSALIYDTEDRNEGMRSFLEKRKAVFKGR